MYNHLHHICIAARHALTVPIIIHSTKCLDMTLRCQATRSPMAIPFIWWFDQQTYRALLRLMFRHHHRRRRRHYHAGAKLSWVQGLPLCVYLRCVEYASCAHGFVSFHFCEYKFCSPTHVCTGAFICVISKRMRNCFFK